MLRVQQTGSDLWQGLILRLASGYVCSKLFWKSFPQHARICGVGIIISSEGLTRVDAALKNLLYQVGEHDKK